MELLARVTDHILDVAVAIMQADTASLQRYVTDRNALKLLNHRGLDAACAEAWEWIFPDSISCCAESLRTGRRVVVPDTEACDFLVADLQRFRICGIRAAQTTPLLDKDGQLVGMVSTHWRQPRQPDPSQLDLFDVWSRQIANMLAGYDAMAQLLQQANGELSRCHRLVQQLEEELNRALKDGRLQLPPHTGPIH